MGVLGRTLGFFVRSSWFFGFPFLVGLEDFYFGVVSSHLVELRSLAISLRSMFSLG